ncbi:unnamed protein product [Echinostoma caproni]|uniref:Reverse transcriptase domain-containing protein n=1 Tax=Echinostoma caproni TaxID=27848 RepID=A0A183BCD9_9TREM|nr:unnamed protein product [Echinostoma caproni]
MPNVMLAEKWATLGEYVNKLVAILQSNASNDTHLVLSLRSEGPTTQFLYRDVTLQSGTTHKFIVDTESTESIIFNAVLRSMCPQAKLQPTFMRILGVTGHQLPLIREVSLTVHSTENRLVPIRFLIAKKSPSILGLTAIRALNHSMSLHTSSLPNVHTRLQRLIVQCSNNTGSMKVRLAKLEVEGEPIFLKRRVIPYGRREGVLKALEKMEHDGILTRVISSAWATPIVITIKSDGKTPRICDDYRLTLNLRLRKCATTTMEPEDFKKALHGSTCFSKINLADAYLQISLDPACR